MNGSLASFKRLFDTSIDRTNDIIASATCVQKGVCDTSLAVEALCDELDKKNAQAAAREEARKMQDSNAAASFKTTEESRMAQDERIRVLEEEVKRLKMELERLQKELERVKNERDSLERMLENTKAGTDNRLESMQKELEEMRLLLERSEAEQKGLHAQLYNFNEKQKELSQTIDDLEEAVMSERTNVQKERAHVRKANQEITRLQALLQQKEEQLNSLGNMKESAEELEGLNTSLSMEVQRERAKYKQAQKALHQLRSEIDTLKQGQSKDKKTIVKLKDTGKELAALRAKITALNDRNNVLEQELANARQEIAKLAKQKKSLRSELQRLKKEQGRRQVQDNNNNALAQRAEKQKKGVDLSKLLDKEMSALERDCAGIELY